MNKKTYVSHIFAILSIGLLAFFGMASSCSSTKSATPSAPAETGVSTVNFSEYAAIPSYAWESLGIVVVRLDPSSQVDVSAALMEKAKALGADDVINVRVDAVKNDDGTFTILAATGTAIKYTPEHAEADTATPAAPARTDAAGSTDTGSDN